MRLRLCTQDLRSLYILSRMMLGTIFLLLIIKQRIVDISTVLYYVYDTQSNHDCKFLVSSKLIQGIYVHWYFSTNFCYYTTLWMFPCHCTFFWILHVLLVVCAPWDYMQGYEYYSSNADYRVASFNLSFIMSVSAANHLLVSIGTPPVLHN